MKELKTEKYPARYINTLPSGVDYYAYRGHKIPKEWVLKCESDERFYRCITRDGTKKITRDSSRFDFYDIDDGKIRMISKTDSSYILEGYKFIGCDGEPYLIKTKDTRSKNEH